MDEPDADQILTIEELRSLRDRMGAEAAAPAAVPSTAQFTVPEPAGVPLDARADPWEDLRRRANGQQHWAGRRWAGPLAAAGALAIAVGGVTALFLTNHSRPSTPPTVEVSRPAAPAPVVTASAPVSVASIPESSVILPVPVVPAPSPPVESTTQPPTAAVPQPRSTYQPKPPASGRARPSPTRAPAPAPPPGAAADRGGPTNAAPEPQATITRTPTSWSPPSPE